MVENVGPMARSGGSLYGYILTGLTCKCGLEHMHVQVETLIQTRNGPGTYGGQTRYMQSCRSRPGTGTDALLSVSVQLVVGLSVNLFRSSTDQRSGVVSVSAPQDHRRLWGSHRDTHHGAGGLQRGGHLHSGQTT